MKKHGASYTQSGQMKNLLIRVWEILRGVGQDLPLSVEDISGILIEQDREMKICEDPLQKDKYNARLIRANIKAINSALAFPAPNYKVTKQRDPDISKRLKSKTCSNSANNSEEGSLTDKIEKCFVGRREDKECLYYNKYALDSEELRFLFDAVQSAAFLSRERADVICQKLAALCGATSKKIRSESVSRPEVSLATDVFDTIRNIELAISHGRRLHFNYFNGWSGYKNPIWEENSLDPIAVLYNDGYYYVYGYNNLSSRRDSFRLDRMANVYATDENSVFTEEWESIDRQDKERMAAFKMRTSATPVDVTFRIPGRLIPDMYDKFGSRLCFALDYKKAGYFTFTKSIYPSSEVLGWCASFGGDLEILLPRSAREAFAKFIIKMQKKCSI